MLFNIYYWKLPQTNRFSFFFMGYARTFCGNGAVAEAQGQIGYLQKNLKSVQQCQKCKS
jgi:hypothetical protein